MPLDPQTKLGHYLILGPLGAGGMGEVYRATDTQLAREVAIKVLPASLANNPQNLARFDREAKVLAALNHPNIAIIFGLVESGGSRALVMELIPGETLADRLKRGPIPLEEACGIARQIAEALEAAHERGVVHRDLKPGNVMLTPSGTVKVLDFGLAAVSSPSQPAGDPENSPTLTMGMTQTGMIMGTAAYMSPEQAAGLAVDRRSDVWSFGVVLWELFTGQRLFKGDTIAHTLAAVLETPVDFEKLTAPAPLKALVKRCLDRDVKNRLQWIGEARVALQGFLDHPEPEAPPVALPTRRSWAGWAAAGLLTLALATLGVAHFRETPPEQPSMSFTLAAPEGGSLHSFAVSPDGRTIAMSVTLAGKEQLWLRTLDNLQARLIPFTEDATYPFWSPDNRYLGFFANGQLKKIGLTGGPAQVLCSAVDGRGGSWNDAGIIIFGPTGAGDSTIQQIPASGGTPKDALKAKGNYKFPTFLPDGRRFLFIADDQIRGGRSGIFLGSLDDGSIEKVRDEIIAPALMLPRDGGSMGQLLFARERLLMAQPFNVQTGRGTGEAVPVTEGVFSPRANYSPVSTSRNGMLLYMQNAAGGSVKLTLFDRDGKGSRAIGEPGRLATPVLSPDGKLIAQNRTLNDSDANIWIRDLERGTDQRFTSGTSRNTSAFWSPQGDRIAFLSNRATPAMQVFVKPLSGAGEAVQLTDVTANLALTQWSPDGKYLVLSQREKGQWDLLTIPADKRSSPEIFLATEFNEMAGKISPDGNWMAYSSDETGTMEIYVRPFPKGAGVWRISTEGGEMPVWSSNGRELFYRTKEGISSVSVSSVSGAFKAGTPQLLFKVPIPNQVAATRAIYDVTSDGKQFLVPVNLYADTAPPVTVITNWSPAKP